MNNLKTSWDSNVTLFALGGRHDNDWCTNKRRFVIKLPVRLWFVTLRHLQPPGKQQDVSETKVFTYDVNIQISWKIPHIKWKQHMIYVYICVCLPCEFACTLASILRLLLFSCQFHLSRSQSCIKDSNSWATMKKLCGKYFLAISLCHLEVFV